MPKIGRLDIPSAIIRNVWIIYSLRRTKFLICSHKFLLGEKKRSFMASNVLKEAMKISAISSLEIVQAWLCLVSRLEKSK